MADMTFGILCSYRKYSIWSKQCAKINITPSNLSAHLVYSTHTNETHKRNDNYSWICCDGVHIATYSCLCFDGIHPATYIHGRVVMDYTQLHIFMVVLWWNTPSYIYSWSCCDGVHPATYIHGCVVEEYIQLHMVMVVLWRSTYSYINS